jgi:hypothetical protein
MTQRKVPQNQPSLAHDDPRRKLKIRRLDDELDRIPGFLERSPLLDDPDFQEWERTVDSLLNELFDPGTYLLRFRQLTIRPIVYGMGGAKWYADPDKAWKSGLTHASKILREALEEASVEMPPARQPVPPERSPHPPLTVTINNQNVFSPSIHVTVSQLMEQLNRMGLTPGENAAARESLATIEEETKGAKRWPIIAQSLETLKSLGKNIYKDVAVPLIVEFLKSEMGVT